MTCNDQMCLPPEDVAFEFKIDAASGKACEGKSSTTAVVPCDCDSQGIYKTIMAKNDSLKKIAETKKDTASQKIAETKIIANAPTDNCSMWLNFLKGILAGLGALIAPCIYAMLPLTVSFFMKQSKSRAQGIRKAVLYGFFIILIFDVFGLAIVAAF